MTMAPDAGVQPETDFPPEIIECDYTNNIDSIDMSSRFPSSIWEVDTSVCENGCFC